MVTNFPIDNTHGDRSHEAWSSHAVRVADNACYSMGLFSKSTITPIDNMHSDRSHDVGAGSARPVQCVHPNSKSDSNLPICGGLENS